MAVPPWPSATSSETDWVPTCPAAGVHWIRPVDGLMVMPLGARGQAVGQRVAVHVAGLDGVGIGLAGGPLGRGGVEEISGGVSAARTVMVKVCVTARPSPFVTRITTSWLPNWSAVGTQRILPWVWIDGHADGRSVEVPDQRGAVGVARDRVVGVQMADDGPGRRASSS